MSGSFNRIGGYLMRVAGSMLCLIAALPATPARADLRITRDHGGYVTEYKAKYERIRARHERVIIDGICNSACTMVFGIVPMNKICVTPRASLGFHQPITTSLSLSVSRSSVRKGRRT